ncbi:hypothetical protein D3C71_2096310 [compost metagenome]
MRVAKVLQVGGFPGIQGDRLFNQHMLASFDRQSGGLGVEGVWRGDVDGIDIRGVGKVLIAPKGTRHLM